MEGIMNQVKSWKIAAIIFSLVLTFTSSPAKVNADDCNEAIFNYYDKLLELMQENKTARAEIGGQLKKAKKSAKKYNTQGSQLKRFGADGIWDDDEKQKVIKMEKKHEKLKKYYQKIQSTAKGITDLAAEVDTLGAVVDSECP